jgi:hypothetical protein
MTVTFLNPARLMRGTCRVCRAYWTRRHLSPKEPGAPIRHKITDANRMAPHMRCGTETPEQFLERFPAQLLVLCDGVGTLCEEAREIARMKRFSDALAEQRGIEAIYRAGAPALMSPHERKLYLIRLTRGTAATVMDALITGEASPRWYESPVGTPFRIEIPWLMRLAIVAWREATEGGTKKAETFKVLDRPRTNPKKVDVYCTFCGRLVWGDVTRPKLRNRERNDAAIFTEATDHHTILCAMERLSGMQEFVSRETYKLPSDDQPEHTQESTPPDDEDV